MKPTIYHAEKLPQGSTLAVATLPHSECTAVSIYIPAGSRDEPHAVNGLAHFVEHMVFKGTSRRSSRDLNTEIEAIGGQINACTSESHTVYEASGDADALPVILDVLCDMVWHATFPESEIPLERDVIGEEITLYRESASDAIEDMISSALWPQHPLGNPITGTHESIARIDRSVLCAFRDSHHFRDEVVIAIAGPHAFDDVKALLAPHLPPHFYAVPQPSAVVDLTIDPLDCREVRETDQLHLALAWHTPGHHSETRHAIRLLSTLLAGSASSRLFNDLREERGLCYQIQSDVSFFADTGSFEISAGLDPESREEALACIFHHIEQLVAHGPTEEELIRSQRLTITQSKLAFESTSCHASWVGEGILNYQIIPDVSHWREQVLAVTSRDVQQAAALIFKGKKPAMAEIGP